MKRSSVTAHGERVKARTSFSQFKTWRTAKESDEDLGGHLFKTLETLPKGSKVLEIGVGRGETLKGLKTKFPHLKFYGTNYHGDTPRGLGATNVIKARGEELPFRSETFNLAFSVGTLQYVPDKLRFLKEIHRTLKTGGSALIDQFPKRFKVITGGQVLDVERYLAGHPEVKIKSVGYVLHVTKKLPKLKIPLRLNWKKSQIQENDRFNSVYNESGRKWWNQK